MAIPKCVLVPQMVPYSMAPGKEVISQQLEGGKGRYRRDISGATAKVQVQWTVTEKWYKYLNCLYIITESGALPFKIDLLMQDIGLTEHTVHFTADGGAPRLVAVDGKIRVVTAELEVEPIVPDVVAAQDYFDMMNGFGEDWSVLDDLDDLVNLTLPGDLPAPGDTGSLPA